MFSLTLPMPPPTMAGDYQNDGEEMKMSDDGMKRYMFVVLTDPMPGGEAEYNEWYNTVHLQDLVKLPGIKAAQRYKLAPISAADGKQKYLALYEIETDDVSKV